MRRDSTNYSLKPFLLHDLCIKLQQNLNPAFYEELQQVGVRHMQKFYHCSFQICLSKPSESRRPVFSFHCTFHRVQQDSGTGFWGYPSLSIKHLQAQPHYTHRFLYSVLHLVTYQQVLGKEGMIIPAAGHSFLLFSSRVSEFFPNL